MVADVEIIRDREARIRQYVADLREMGRASEVHFIGNRERQYAVLHALQLAIEASVDIAVHICAADNLGIPSSYTEAFDLLERGNAVDSTLAIELRAMARFRNRVVHLYAAVDLHIVYRLIHEELDTFDRYLAAVERYLQPPRT